MMIRNETRYGRWMAVRGGANAQSEATHHAVAVSWLRSTGVTRSGLGILSIEHDKSFLSHLLLKTAVALP